MKLLFVGAVVTGLTLAGAAMAQEKPAAPVAPTAAPAAAVPATADAKAAKSAQDKRAARDAEVICYNDFDVGSHVNHTRVCMTRGQREDRAHDTARALDDLTSNVPQAPPKGGLGSH